MRSLKLILATVLMAVGLTGFAFMPAYAAGGAAGDAKENICDGVTAVGGSCDEDGDGLTSVIKLIIQIISAIAGVAAVIMIVVAGLRYITSGGDASKVSGAKSAIIYAIVGLVVVALSQIIVRFVIDNTV